MTPEEREAAEIHGLQAAALVGAVAAGGALVAEAAGTIAGAKAMMAATDIAAGEVGIVGPAAVASTAFSARRPMKEIGPAIREMGTTMEMAVQAVYEGAAKGYKINGRRRIADLMTEFVVREVKNVSFQGLTSQIRDAYDYAVQTGRAFVIHVREDTILSKALRDWAKRNGVKIEPVEGFGKNTPFGPNKAKPFGPSADKLPR